MKDYYKILGIEKSASKDDIKKAFRKLAHEHHPDKNGGDASKFKEASEAYSVLSDDNKRKQYDTFGSAGGSGGFGFGDANGFGGNAGFNGFDFSNFSGNFGGFGGGNSQNFEFDLGDIFGDMFGGGRKRKERHGADMTMNVHITFEESVFGVNKLISFMRTAVCPICHGDGGKQGSHKTKCDECNGNGKINEVKRSIFGSFSTTKICSKCNGRGDVYKDKCENCRGNGLIDKKEELTIRIPAGMENGEMLRVSQMGEAVRDGKSGDLYVKVLIGNHKIFKKEGQNLSMDLAIKLTMALEGGEINLETLDGNISLKIPEGINHNEILRVKNKGVPSENGKGRGDLMIKIKVEMPRRLSRNAKKLIEELKKEGI